MLRRFFRYKSFLQKHLPCFLSAQNYMFLCTVCMHRVRTVRLKRVRRGLHAGDRQDERARTSRAVVSSAPFLQKKHGAASNLLRPKRTCGNADDLKRFGPNCFRRGNSP